MVKYSVCKKIDGYRKVAIPKKICKILEWECGTILYCLVQEKDNKLYIFQNIHDFKQEKKVIHLETRKMDNLYRIVVPKQIMDCLEWKKHDNIIITFKNKYVCVEKC